MKKLLCLIIVLAVCFVNSHTYTETLTYDIEKNVNNSSDSTLYERLYVDYVNNSEIEEVELMAVTNYSLEDIYSYTYNILKSHNTFYYESEDNLMKIPLYASGFRLNEDDMMEFIYKFLNECGELFLTKAYAAKLYVNEDRDEIFVYNLYFRYFMPIDSLDAELENIDEIVAPFLTSIDENMGELEKTLLARDYIASISRYKTNDDNFNKQHYHSMYGIFVNGVAVCQGYTEAMCYLLNKLGVECVSCVCNDINHVWNCVKIDGKWYHVDLTWDDKYQTNGIILIDGVSYDNFLISFDKVLTLKEGQYTYDMNDDYVYDEEGNHVLFEYENGDFIYPLSEVTDRNSNNNEYEKDYIFNGVKITYFSLSEGVFEKIVPKGFNYSDGKWILKTESEGILLAQEHIFEFDSVKAMDYAVSKPVKFDDGYYRFLKIAQNKPLTESLMSMYVKTVTNEGITDIQQNSARPILMVGPYAYYGVKDLEFSQMLDNSVSAEFYVWNINLLKPFSYKIIKSTNQ